MKANNLKILTDNGFNVPKFITVRHIDEIDMSFSDKKLFAVRSSSELEDNKDISYAGQFNSFLNISKDDIITSVLSVKNSYNYIKDYLSNNKRNKNNDILITDLESKNRKKDINNLEDVVIIQEMINSDISGVMFTGNPMGILNETVIVVGNGLGENIVEDKVNTTTYFYNIDDDLYYKEKQGNSCEISEVQLKELVDIGKRIEEVFNMKMDVEFAIENGVIYILQARPITTLNTDNLIILDNSNIVESYPGISLPLTQSIVKNIYYMIFKYCVANVVKDDKVMSDIDSHLQDMVDVANGRIYYRISNWYYILKMLPFSSRIIPIWQEMLGVKNNFVLAEDYKFNLKLKGRIFKNFFKILKNTPKEIEELNIFFAEKYKDCRTNLYKLNTVKDILWYFEEYKEDVISKWYITLMNDMYAFLFTALSGKRNKSLLANISDLESMKPIKVLNRLLEIRNEMGENSEEYKDCFSNYIEEFGDRCLNELKFESKTYRTNPELFTEYLKEQTVVEINNISIEESKNIFVKKAKQGIYNREVSRMNRTRLFGFVRDVFLYIGEISVKEGKLEDKRDVFYLFYNELKENIDYRSLVIERKEKYKMYENIPTYSRLVFSEKIIDKNVNITDVSIVSDTELYGIGTSVGVVEGEVIVIDNSDLTIDTTDKIIVTKMTEPAWVFLIKNSKGIIAEQGSLLSHTAIISRELHKPAVVNVKNALQILHTGDKVRIDGLKGVVEILKEG